LAEHGLAGSRSGWRPRSGVAGKLITLALLFILLAAVISGLTAVLQGPDWAAIWLSLLLGLWLAWGLALLRQPPWRAAALLTLAGLLFLLLGPGGLAGKLVALVGGLIHFFLTMIPLYNGIKIDPGELVKLSQSLSSSIGIMLQRIQVWTKALVAGKPIFDPLAASLVWNGLVWVVAAWAGWVVEARRNLLLAVFPAIMLDLGTLSSGQHMFPGLYLILGLTLLMLAIVQQNDRQRGWIAGKVAYPAHKGRQIVNTALLVTVLLVLLSALLSSLSAERIRRWIDDLRRPAPQQHSDLAQSLGILPGGTPVPDEFRSVRSPGLPRDHLIGSGPELSSRVVMTVKVDDLASLSQTGQPLPLYWRGFTYDIYTGQGWSSSETATDPIAANAFLQADHAQDHILIREEVSPVEDLGGTIYAAGEPVRLNLDSQAAWRSTGDLFGVRTRSTSAYSVISLVPVADEAALRQAGEIYPDWVRQRFLVLPSGVPERVKTLALRLTASAATPYDRAVAIEDYLRTYPYTLDLPRPPQQRDVVDYFLFDLKKGYCDYFATAMVVLARAAGLPARLVIGYAPGTFNLNSKRFVITEADAHSWVEVYFPDIGWVPFEPTPFRPVLDRSLPLPPEMPESANLPGQTTGQVRTITLPRSWLPVAALGLSALLGLAWLGLDRLRLRHLPEPVAANEIYRRMRRQAGHLGAQTEAGATPFEFSAALCSTLADLTAQGIPAFIKNKLVEEVRAIVDQIVIVSYRPSPSTRGQLVNYWLGLRWRLWLVWARKAASRARIRRYSQTAKTIKP
jgi:transglutaminase-like putative cysteine protease